MKKIILSTLIIFLLFISVSIADSIIASINVTWQLSFDTLKPNSDGTISLTITNSGNSYLTKVVIKSAPGNYVNVTSGNEINIGSLSTASSQQSILSIKVDEDAPSTISYISLNVEYYYTETTFYEKTFYIPIRIIRDPLLQIENVNFSSHLSPGNTVNLNFDLKNEGIGNARDIVVSLGQSSNFITTDSSGEYFINRLNNSQLTKLTLPLTISPDATIGTTTIPIKITYYDETRTKNYTDLKDVGALITGKYNFIVTPDSQDIMTAGTTGTATIKIANGGNQQAFHLTVNVMKSNNFDITPTVIYVGNLNSDDYDSEKLTLKVGSIDSGYYPINLNISYEDSFGNTYNEIYSVNVKISSRSEYAAANQSQSPLVTLLIVIVIIIIFFVVYRKGYLNKLFKRK